MWHGMLLSPIIYLLFARLCVRWEWIVTGPNDPHPWDDVWVRCGIGLVTLVVAGGIVWLRRLRPLSVRALASDPTAALRRWVWDFYLMAGFADGLALLGLIFYSISGQEWALLSWGAAAYVGFALTYPRQSELADLPEPPEPPQSHNDH